MFEFCTPLVVTHTNDDDFVHPKLSTLDEEAKDEENFDPIVQTPSQVENSDDENNNDESHGMNVGGDEGPDAEDNGKELYRDVKINLDDRDVQMTNVHTTQVLENTHVTLTPVNPNGQQQSSSVSSQFVTSMFNLSRDAAPTPTTAPSSSLQDLPNFGSLFGFDHRLKTLEANFSEFMQTNQFAEAVSFIPNIVDRYINHRMNEAVKVAIESNKSIRRLDEQRNLYKALVDAYECDKIILDTYGDKVTLKRRRDDADKDEEPSAGSDRGSKRRREGKEPASTSAPKEKASKTTSKSTKGSKSHQKTTSESAPAEEPMQTTQDLEEPSHQEFETGVADDQPIAEASQHPECDLAKQADSRTSFNELMDTPVDFLVFLMNRLKVNTLTPELLAGPTYELMKGSCESLVELKFFLEKVYKETIDQLDWNNPEGHQYPHNPLKPLPLITNSRGCRVIPFDHFINNDLEYLCDGASSQKYTTSVTKTKAADYGHIKGANVNSSTDLRSTGSLLKMSTQNVESSLSSNFRLLNGTTTSTWIRSLNADQSHCQRTICFQRLFKNVHEKHSHPTACRRSSIRCQKLPKEAQSHKAGYTVIAFCLGKTLPVSKLGCVLSRELVAFGLEDFLCFVSRLDCVLSQDLLRFVSRLLRFVSRLLAFCLHLKTFSAFWTDFASWQQRIRLYCRGIENGVNILKSIDEGPYQMGTVREPLAEGTEGAPQLGPERPRVYSDLSPEEKDRHLGQCQDAPRRVRFDQRGSGVTALNSKFMNNMLPEWGRFVTAVKFNRGLRDSNYDQLYAYLKQHETHAKENKMMLERFSQHTVDPLALMSNVSNPQRYSPLSSTSSSTQVPQHLADNPHLDLSIDM
nr:retrovirus-related Pol polyprotein from transposon TNT 1-94 [Tanacetum cinerariifolium]